MCTISNSKKSIICVEFCPYCEKERSAEKIVSDEEFYSYLKKGFKVESFDDDFWIYTEKSTSVCYSCRVIVQNTKDVFKYLNGIKNRSLLTKKYIKKACMGVSFYQDAIDSILFYGSNKIEFVIEDPESFAPNVYDLEEKGKRTIVQEKTCCYCNEKNATYCNYYTKEEFIEAINIIPSEKRFEKTREGNTLLRTNEEIETCDSCKSCLNALKNYWCDNILGNGIYAHGVATGYSGFQTPTQIYKRLQDVYKLEHFDKTICCSHKTQLIGPIGCYVQGNVEYISNADLYSIRTSNDKRVFNVDDCYRNIPVYKPEKLKIYRRAHIEVLMSRPKIRGLWVKENYAKEHHEVVEVLEVLADVYGVKLYTIKEKKTNLMGLDTDADLW